jgi:hypothetical protein
MLNVIMLNVIMLSVIVQSVIMLSVIMLSVIVQSVDVQCVVVLNVIMLIVVAPLESTSYTCQKGIVWYKHLWLSSLLEEECIYLCVMSMVTTYHYSTALNKSCENWGNQRHCVSAVDNYVRMPFE